MKVDILQLKEEIIAATELAALAVLRLQNPKFDQVTKTEAYEIAGRRWLDYHIEKKNIKGFRLGRGANSPIYFSRLEISALMKAESTAKATLKQKKYDRITP